MKLVKSALATALAIASISPVQAEEPTIYGKANISFQASDEGNGSFTELKSNASRFGIMGDYQLDENLTVVYRYEMQIDLADESGEENLKSRNQYVGLKGSFGELLLGRNDTMLKQSQGKIDLFSDYEADLKHTWKGENRMSDSISYKTAKFNHFQFGVTYIVEDDPAGEDGISASLTYGDKNLKKNQFYGAIAIDSDVKGYDTARLMGQFKVGEVKLGLGWQNQEKIADGSKKDGALISASYNMGKTTLKAQVQTLEDDNTTTIGVDYKLGKKTKLFAWYTDKERETSNDSDYLAVGIEHKF